MIKKKRGIYDRQRDAWVKAYFEVIGKGHDGDSINLFESIDEILDEFSTTHPATKVFHTQFHEAILKYEHGDAWTLDEAFGLKDARKGLSKSTLRFRMKNGWEIYSAVQSLKKGGTSDTKAREIVAKNYPYGPGTILEICEWVESLFSSSKGI